MSSMDILAAIDAAVGCQQCGASLDGSVSDDFCTQDCQTDWHAERADALVGYQEPWHRPWDFPGVGTDEAVSGERAPYVRPSWTSTQAFIDRGNGWEPIGQLRDGFTFTARAVDPATLPPNPDQPTITRTIGPIRASPLSAQIVFGNVIRTESLEFRLPRSTGNLSADWRALMAAQAAATTDAQRAACRLRRDDLTQRLAAMTDSISAGFTAFSDHLGQVWESLSRGIMSNPAAREYLGYPEQGQPGRGVSDGDVRQRALDARRNRNTGPPERRRAPRRLDAPGARH